MNFNEEQIFLDGAENNNGAESPSKLIIVASRLVNSWKFEIEMNLFIYAFRIGKE